MNAKELLTRRLEELSIRPKRSLGQNFLINDKAIDQIVGEALRDIDGRLVVEVGPGLGSLTERLPRSSLLIELDETFARYWKDRGFQVLEADALKVNWDKLLDGPFHDLTGGNQVRDLTGGNQGFRITLVSNLPYQIAASLVVEVSCSSNNIDKMVLMFQKEVADRILAKPNTSEYGFLSVAAQTFWDVQSLIKLSPRDFYPAPKVASRVLRFLRKEPQVRVPSRYINFLKRNWQNRRKLLVKNLQKEEPILKNALSLEDLLSKHGLSLLVRAGELSPGAWVALYRELHEG